MEKLEHSRSGGNNVTLSLQGTNLNMAFFCTIAIYLSYRIDFKILLLVYKALSGAGPAHLFHMLKRYELQHMK